MNGQPAVSARLLGRRLALAVGFFVLISGASCGRQTFDLLGLDASAPNGGSPGMGGATPSQSGGRGGFQGTDHGGSGAGSSRAGAGTGGQRNFAGNGGAGGEAGAIDQPCLPGESCVDGGVTCPPTANFCKRCSSDAECGRDSPPYCDVVDGRCVECLPSRGGCKLGEACDAAFYRCAKACLSNQDCAATSHPNCAVSRGVCVECISNPDCDAVAGHGSYQCAAGFCVECTGSINCHDMTKPFCVQFQCVAKQ